MDQSSVTFFLVGGGSKQLKLDLLPLLSSWQVRYLCPCGPVLVHARPQMMTDLLDMFCVLFSRNREVSLRLSLPLFKQENILPTSLNRDVANLVFYDKKIKVD